MTRKFDFTTGRNNNLISRLAVLVVTSFALCAAVAQADIVMSLNKITTENDVYTNVPNKSSVKYAINYGQHTVSAPIDGVTFVNYGASYYTEYTHQDGDTAVLNGYSTPQLSFNSRNVKNILNHGGGSYSGSSVSALNDLLWSMIFNDGEPANSNAVMTFGNLEAGKTYTARILARTWQNGFDGRVHTFSIDTNADGVADEFYSNMSGSTVTGQLVSEDNPFSYAGESGYGGAYAVDFTFTAQSNTATINLLSGSVENRAWHHYGVMLIETTAEQVKPTTPTLYNGSFEADVTHLPNDGHNGHAYLNENNVGILSGWQFTNLTNTAMRGGLAWVGGPCQDFLGNQTPPDGRQLAWVQSGSSVDARLYQNVYGFDPTDKNTVYRVSMDLGGRTATDNPRVSLFIGPDQATEDVYINAKEVTKGQFKEYGAVFVPNSDVQTIAIRNLTTTDTSLLVDNVQLKAYNLRNFFSDNYHVKANATGPNIGGPTSNDEPDRFGGLLGAMGYTIGVKSNNQIQVGSGDYEGKCKGSLFFATLSASGNDQSQSHASPDYNFANVGAMSAADEGGRMYDISFRVAPQFDEAADSSNWAAVMFGLTESKRTANVNGSDGVGILFRRNGGIQIFDGTNGQAQQNFGAGTYELTDDWADVRVVFFVPDFDGTSPVDVSLYVNDKLISSFQTGKGFLDNFIQLEGYSGNSGYKRSLVDDLVVKASAELRYEVSRIKDMTRAWSPNGIDKLDVFFTDPRNGETTATHTGALNMGVNTDFNVAEGYTIDQAGATTGSGNINKIGKGTLRLSGNASEYTGTININEGSVDFGFNDTVTMTNDVTGDGNLIKSGTGKLTLTRADYEGSTTVNSGVLSAEILSTDSIIINGGKLEVGFLSAEPPVTINGGQFVVGNTSASATLTISNLTLTNGGSISFDMNSFLGDDWDYLETPTANLENGFINLTFNNGDELAWWSNAGEYGYELIDITSWLGGVSNMKVTVDGVESPSWWVDYDNGGIYLMATEVSPTASKYYLANLQSDLDAANWTIDGDAKLGAKLMSGGNLNVTYGKPVILNADGEFEVGDSYNLTLSNVSGSKALNKTGYGTLTLSGANTYTGATTITSGTLALTAENAIASSSSVTNNSAITMGAAQTLNNLSGTGTVNNGGFALTLNNNAATEFAGVISGEGALVKSGSGTLTLSGTNNYTGGTTINAGTLKVAGAGTLGNAPVTNNAILEYAVGEGESMEIGYTIANNGSGKTVKTGAGNLSLTSTTTGNFEIQEGTVTMANALGNTGRRFSQVTIGPGASLLGAAKDSIGHNADTTSIINVYGTFDTTVENETLLNVQLHMYGGTAKATSGSTFDMYNNNTKVYSHALDGASAENPTVSTISAVLLVRNNVTLDITTDANTQLNVSSVIRSENGAGKVVKYGEGTLYLTAENSFQGGFEIKEGRVISKGGNTSPTNLGSGPITIEKNAVLDLQYSNQFGYGAGSPPDVTIRGTLIPYTFTHIKNLTLEDGLVEAENGYADNGTGFDFATRTGTITSTGNSTIKSRIHINAGATATFNVPSGTLTVDGIIKSDGGFTKTGAGTMKLTAANTYTGATTVSEGTLHLTNTGSLVSSGVTVATGATFIDAAPSIASAVTLNGGTLTLGDSASAAAITIGDFAVTGGTVNFDFFSTDYDVLTTGAATLTSGTINLTFNNGSETTWWNNAPDAGYVLMQTSGLTADLTNLQVNVSNAATTSWYLATADNNLVLKKLDGPQPPDPPTPSSDYYLANSDDISAPSWTIDETNKKGAKFIEGDQSAVTYNGSVDMQASGTFEVAANKELTIAGVISGSGDVTKLGAGTLTLSGDNTYTGETTVSAGTLNLTKTGQKGTLATGSTLTVVGDSSVVTGHGDIFGYTDGTVATINLTDGGTLHNDSTDAHITMGAVVNMNSGVISAENGDGSSTYGNYVFDNAINVLGGTDNVINANRITLRNLGAAGAGKITVAENAKLTISSQIFNPDGNFIPLVKLGAGELVLSGDCTYTSETFVNEGTLRLTKVGQKGTLAAGSTVTVDGATSVLAGHGDIIGYTDGSVGTINLQNGGTLHNDATADQKAHVTVDAVVNMNSGYITTVQGAQGNDTYGNYVFDNAINVQGGTDNVITANRITLRNLGAAGAGKITVAEDAKLTISSQIFDPDGNFIPLVKQGAGTLTLSGDNTYSTATTVSEGILQLTGDAVKANSSIEIANGATLEYNVPTSEKSLDFTTSNTTISGGNVSKTGEGKLKIKADGTQFSAGDFTVSNGELDFKGQYNGNLIVKNGATLSPGNSVGDLTVYGNAIIETGATGLFEFSSYNEDPAQQSFDRLFIADNGSFVIDSNSIIKLFFEAGDTDAALWAAEGSEYKLVSDEGFDTSITPTLGNYTGMFDLLSRNDGLWLIGLGAGPIPPGPEPGSGVPEPSTWALLMLGAMGLYFIRQKKSR